MKKIFSRKTLLALALVLPLLFAFTYKTDLFEVSKNLEIFNHLYKVLNEAYVDETKPGQLMKTAIDGMLESLDPYTVYITENDIEEYMFMATGEYGGIGAAVTDIDGKIIVVDPYEGFSAQKGGIKAGDEIIEINGTAVKGKRSDDVQPLLKGQAGSPITLKVIHPGETTPVELKLQRQEIRIPAVPYYNMLNENTGIIKLTSFTENCSALVKEALLKLKEKNCKSVILDMRGNPGGLMLEAVNIVNLFTEKGNEVVATRGKVQDWDKTYMAVNNPIDLQIPLAVLIDENSASASEIVAGCLQDFDRAVLVGARSYGKGLVQQTKELSYNAKLKITVAKYYIPSGRCIQALDYSRKDPEGRVDKVPDSLITAFKTRGGRIVYDGAGILPDVNTAESDLSHILISIITKNHLFKYATEYTLKHPAIPSAKEFKLSDAEYTDFISYLKDKDYSYKTEAEMDLEDIKKEAEKAKYFPEIKSEYDALVNKMQVNKKDDLVKYKYEIKQYLEEEIVSRYYYQKGRFELMFKNDKDVQKAVEILNEETRLKSILTTIEKPTKPFNPRKRF